MSDHDNLRAEIPAFVSSKLEGEAHQVVERHLSQCQECAALAENVRIMAEAIRTGGEEIFEPHPDALTLRRHALGESIEEAEPVARHLEICAACALEIEFWRGRRSSADRLAEKPSIAPFPSPRGSAPGPAGRARGGRSGYAALSLAAGLLLGAGLVLLFPRVRAPALPPSAPAGDLPSTARPWQGAAPLLILPSPLRGEPSMVKLRIPAGAPFVVIALQPTLAENVSGTERYRIDILAEERSPVWSSTLTAEQIKAHLAETEVLTFVIPASALPPGAYELRVNAAAQAGAALLEHSFEILP